MSPQPLKVGMIGGGSGAFIANPHQKAIHFDGTRKVHSVALGPDPEVAIDEANNWPYPVMGFASYDAMFAAQADLPKRTASTTCSLSPPTLFTLTQQ